MESYLCIECIANMPNSERVIHHLRKHPLAKRYDMCDLCENYVKGQCYSVYTCTEHHDIKTFFDNLEKVPTAPSKPLLPPSDLFDDDY